MAHSTGGSLGNSVCKLFSCLTMNLCSPIVWVFPNGNFLHSPLLVVYACTVDTQAVTMKGNAGFCTCAPRNSVDSCRLNCSLCSCFDLFSVCVRYHFANRNAQWTLRFLLVFRTVSVGRSCAYHYQFRRGRKRISFENEHCNQLIIQCENQTH